MLKVGNFKATQNEEGEWIYKAESPKLKSGKLKAKYRDLPRYKAIYVIEDEYKKSFDSLLKDMFNEIKLALR